METNELISERFKMLPKEIQEMMTAPDTSLLIKSLGEQHHLHIDQMGALENEVLLVMLGLEKASTLADNIRHATHLSESDANEIAIEINEKLLMPIRDSFHRLYQEDEGRENEQLREENPTSLDDTGFGELKTQLPESAFSKAPKKAATPPLDTDNAVTPATQASEAPTEPAAPSIEAARLSGETNLPKTEREIDKLVKEKLPPKQAATERAAPEAPSTKPSDSVDPYREPVS